MRTRLKSPTTIESRKGLPSGPARDTRGRRMRPIHPGEMLREEFLVPLGMSAHSLALAIQVPATRIGEIVNERRGITAETALRLSDFFGMTPEFWMNLQARYELELARDAMAARGYRGVHPAAKDKNGLLKAAV